MAAFQSVNLDGASVHKDDMLDSDENERLDGFTFAFDLAKQGYSFDEFRLFSLESDAERAATNGGDGSDEGYESKQDGSEGSFDS